MEPGLDALWESLKGDLSPEAEQMLLRLIKAHVAFLTELVRTAEQAT